MSHDVTAALRSDARGASTTRPQATRRAGWATPPPARSVALAHRGHEGAVPAGWIELALVYDAKSIHPRGWWNLSSAYDDNFQPPRSAPPLPAPQTRPVNRQSASGAPQGHKATRPRSPRNRKTPPGGWRKRLVAHIMDASTLTRGRRRQREPIEVEERQEVVKRGLAGAATPLANEGMARNRRG